MRLSSRRENVEDKCGSVDHLLLQRLFHVAQLSWRQFIVHQDEVEGNRLGECDKFLQFAGANILRSIWMREVLGDRIDDIDSSSFGEPSQLFER